jgi:haloalkane dehalogenase
MKVLRTPEARFKNLSGFPFEPHYIEVDDCEGGLIRMHFVDEGPSEGELIVCVHGQPSWSYSFRKMISPLTNAGYRVVVPDLVGFGRSDKPSKRSDYSVSRHVFWFTEFINKLLLQDITIVCHDWGGPISLRAIAENPQKFSRVIATNTGFPDSRGVPEETSALLRQLLAETPALSFVDMMKTALKNEDAKKPRTMTEQTRDAAMGFDPHPPFMYWIRHCDAYPNFDPGDIISHWLNHCSAEEKRAYSAPFPSEEFKQGAREFPSLIPLFPDDPALSENRAAWAELRKFEKPFLTAYSDSEPLAPAIQFQQEIPGAKNQKHAVIEAAKHFLQDDAGEELARVIIDFISANKS